ncbi:Fic family protein [Stenotrophomonas maltophilia]|nr:Fic family protein [Stenotrophomonas maltophilia]
MAGTPFKGWDYEHFPDHATRHARCVQILVDLTQGRIDPASSSADPRPIHERMFSGMCEPGQEYFAGHYRGEQYGFLENYNVTVPQDARVGAPSNVVVQEMQRYGQDIDQTFANMAALLAVQDPNYRLIASVGAACVHLVDFLSIHPFANGNGHIGRYVVWAILHALGIHPRRWPLNDKIPQPYGTLITEFRNQNREPLIRFVLAHI